MNFIPAIVFATMAFCFGLTGAPGVWYYLAIGAFAGSYITGMVALIPSGGHLR